MSEREIEIKRTWQFLKNNVLKYAKIENMLMYLSPEERRVFCHMLAGKVKNPERYESARELYEELSCGKEEEEDGNQFRASELIRI